VRLQDRIADELFLALRFIAGAQRMIENHHPCRARLFADQLLDFRIINSGQLLFLEKIRHAGRV